MLGGMCDKSYCDMYSSKIFGKDNGIQNCFRVWMRGGANCSLQKKDAL